MRKGNILVGYRAQGITLYKTDIKPLGYVVAGLGFVSLGVAVIPNGLGVVAYPLSLFLLGLVGISIDKYKRKLKYEFGLFQIEKGWK